MTVKGQKTTVVIEFSGELSITHGCRILRLKKWSKAAIFRTKGCGILKKVFGVEKNAGFASSWSWRHDRQEDVGAF
jgi:hypothetical protein